MAPKRKAKEPGPEPPATADPVGNNDQNDVEKEDDDEDEVEVRLLRSVVHDEYTQTSEKKEIRKGGKKKNVVTWKSACKHCDMEFDHKKISVLKKHLHSKHPPVDKIVEDTDDHAREAQKADRAPPSRQSSLTSTSNILSTTESPSTILTATASRSLSSLLMKT